MPGTSSLPPFMVAALIVLLIPGPAVLYVVTRSVTQGRRAGLISVLGISTGAFVHVAAATVGLSAVLAASAIAFGIVKAVGAAYLIYLGVSMITAEPGDVRIGFGSGLRSYRRLFIDGVIVSIFNPKVALFFLAFLPQFVDRSRGSVPSQLLLLGLIYIALSILTDGGYAVLAAKLARWLDFAKRRQSVSRRIAGVVYIGLGIGTAVNGRRA